MSRRPCSTFTHVPGWLQFVSRSVTALLLAAGAIALPAAALEGISFQHNDWELACDNTGTCRAAGYQPEGAPDADNRAVSVLLTRAAGARQAVSAELMLGHYGDESELPALPPDRRVRMAINGKPQGTVVVGDDMLARLDAAQVEALLQALPRSSSRIEWRAKGMVWRLSDAGAAAVLLKMDEFQKRLGTVGALIRKGNAPETTVLAPQPPLVIHAAPMVPGRPGDRQLLSDKRVRTALLKLTKDEECERASEADGDWQVQRLSDSMLLASAECWMAAYNAGRAYWLVQDKAPYKASLVTSAGSGFEDGSISASHKGRGLGDCWSHEEWVWDGQRFVHARDSSSGMCRLVAPGGAWDLPTLVSQVVRRPAR